MFSFSALQFVSIMKVDHIPWDLLDHFIQLSIGSDGKTGNLNSSDSER